MNNKKVVAAVAVAAVLAAVVGAKVYASVNPSCAAGWTKTTNADKSVVFCMKEVRPTIEIKAR
jgi:hypothetical protein